MNLFIKLLKLARNHWWRLAVATAALLSVTGINLISPLVVRELLAVIRNEGISSAIAMSRIARLGMLLAFVYLLRTGFQFVSNYVNHVAAWSFVGECRARIYDHLQSLSMKFYQDKQTGELMSRVINDTANFETLIAHAVPEMISNVLVLVGVSTILFSIEPKLALMTLIPMPLLVWAVGEFARKARPAYKRDRAAIAELNGVLQDNLSGIKEIQAFTQEGKESKRVKDAADEYTAATLMALRIGAFYHPLIEFLGGIGTIVVVWYGGRLALAGTISIEDIVAFVMYLGMFYGPISALNRVNEAIQSALAGAERTFELLSLVTDIKEPENPRVLKKVQGAIRFENVHFSYVDGYEVLSGINLDIAPGETVALVGPTGVGKTTIAGLIPRFHDPKSGKVTLDGVDLKTLSLTELRQNISMVLQDVFLFSGTVKDNLLYSRPDSSEEEMVRASKLARAHDFIMALPEGYNTQIGERGVKLSGGQKQRLSIARAILRDSPILILDEATSAVDTETEEQIQQALAELSKGRTTIIIAHRLSTVKKADKIVVLEDGHIVEMGRHDKLMTDDGLYARLSRVQLA